MTSPSIKRSLKRRDGYGRQRTTLKRQVVKKDNLLTALSALDTDYEKIEGFDVVNDGVYWATVEDVVLGMPQHSGSPRITWRLRILGPDHHGRQLRRVLVVTRDNLRWLKRDLYVCGLAVMSLTDLAGSLDNLLNLKIRVRKFGRAVHILDADAPISANGHLFLHLIDETGHEYLDQQLQQRQQPRDQQEFEALIDHFLTRYHCRRPDEAYIEDAKTGVIVFRMEASKGNLQLR